VIMFQVFYMLSCRSLNDSVFRIGFVQQQDGVHRHRRGYWPCKRCSSTPRRCSDLLHFPLTAQSLVFSALAGAIILPVISVEKLIRNRSRA